MTTHYGSASRGPIEIATMPFRHLQNAYDKLLVSRIGDERQDEVDAMRDRLRVLQAEHEAAEAAKGRCATSSRGGVLVNAHASIAEIGHNNPPLSPFEAHKANIDDLYTEAKNWCDGEPISTQAQHDEVERLLDLIREAHDAADEARKIENKPFDDGKAEVQARYAPLISDTKAVQGKTVLAKAACLAMLNPWRKKVADEKAAEAQRLQDIADEKIRLATEAARAAEPTNLEASEEVESLIADARIAQKTAARADKGATTGTGLRTYYTPTMTDGVVAARHYWAVRRPEYEAFFLSLAKADVLSGKRSIPGFEITEDRRAI